MISVITPVYNAEIYLPKAIESVLIQPEVSEYILVDDGSTDESWRIIQKYRKIDNRIIALRHPDYKNHGRSRTRNLGIKYSTNEWIAFLDADDFYLQDRFKNDLNIISQDTTIDGVYNAIQAHFYESYKGSRDIPQSFTTMKEVVLPEILFERMRPYGNLGRFSGDGFLVKKSALQHVGGFNEKLEVAEDTELWSKLSLIFRLVPGILNHPVAIRGIHGENVFLKPQKYLLSDLLMFHSLLKFVHIHSNCEIKRKIVVDKYLSYLSNYSFQNFFEFFKYWFTGLFISSSTLVNKKFYVILKNKIFSINFSVFKFRILIIFYAVFYLMVL